MNSVKQDTLRLWATPIYQQTLDNGGLELIKQLAVEELDQDFNFLKDLQDIRPWSTHDLLHQKKEWELVANWLAQQADLALTDQGFKYEEVYITSMWLNVSWQKHNHAAHAHANSLLSGCLYITMPENSQGILFRDPRQQAQVFMPRGFSGEQHLISPVEGTLLMWPAWLLHSTLSLSATELSEPRITLAFNMMIRDNIDSHSIRLNLK